jgi:hypothetical protein
LASGPTLGLPAELFRQGLAWSARDKAEALLAQADAVLNVAGATRFAEEDLRVGRLVYFGTDPGHHEIGVAGGDPAVLSLIGEHHDAVTYGENMITQDTGFGACVPTGEGLFAFNTLDDVMSAFEAVSSDYARHSRAARAIAKEYFRAETVLARLLSDLGI